MSDRTVQMEAPPLERKLAAILAADVEGYSRLMNVDEEQTLATLTSHRTIVDGSLKKRMGRYSARQATACWLSSRPSFMLSTRP